MQKRSDITVEYVDGYGSDERISQAARVSTLGSASIETKEAGGLINYLMSHRHGSPFEHGGMTFLIEAPIFVFREFHRHRVGWSYNETSGRYKELEPVFYVPAEDRPFVNAGTSARPVMVPGSDTQVTAIEMATHAAYKEAWSRYQQMLKAGVAKEVSRIVLPVGIYSSMYATCNPRSLMHFLSLRTHNEDATFVSYPQREIEMVAEKMERVFAEMYPLTFDAWVNNGRVAP